MALRPATAENLYDAATIAVRLKRPRDAEVAWTRVRREFPDHSLAARASLELAQAAFGREQWKEAATLAVAAAKGTDGALRAEAHLLHGESELKLRRFAAAHQAFQAVVASPGVDAQIRYRALAGSGLAMEEQQQWAQAARYYEEVATKSPDRSLKSWARERHTAVGARVAKPSRSAPPKSTKP
jgi:TolA-binding protein